MLWVEGEVILVLVDCLLDECSEVLYYWVCICVGEEGVCCLVGLEICLGMLVEVFVCSGECLLLNYLFKLLVDCIYLVLGEE